MNVNKVNIYVGLLIICNEVLLYVTDYIKKKFILRIYIYIIIVYTCIVIKLNE